MTVPVIASYATVSDNDGVNDTSFVITKPTGTVAGDLLIAFVQSGVRTVTASGFTQISTAAISGGGRLTTLYKVAGASEPANYTFTFSGLTSDWAAGLMRVTGAISPATTAIVSATDTKASGISDPIAPAVVPTANDSLVLMGATSSRVNIDISATPGTQVFIITNFTSDADLAVGRLSGQAGISTGTGQFTSAVHREWVTTTLAIAPSAAAGNPWNYYRQMA